LLEVDKEAAGSGQSPGVDACGTPGVAPGGGAPSGLHRCRVHWSRRSAACSRDAKAGERASSLGPATARAVAASMAGLGVCRVTMGTRAGSKI